MQTMTQTTLATAAVAAYSKTTRKEAFLKRMDALVAWQAFTDLIEPTPRPAPADQVAASKVLLAACNRCAVFHQWRSLGCRAVPDADLVPRLEQALDHRFAHAPQTNPAYRACHVVAS